MIYSNTEFYYANPNRINDSTIYLEREEAKHLIQVMRHSFGDVVYVTDGIGNVYESKIVSLSKSDVSLEILKVRQNEQRFPNTTLFIPILKASDRFEFALEKCVELGITSFVIFSAEKSYKRGVKLERWEKITLAAMKQSLQTFIPRLEFRESLQIDNTDNTRNFVFDQLAEKRFSHIESSLDKDLLTNLIFGPEAGLTQNEIDNIPNSDLVFLTKNRLRAETAVISAASLLGALIK